MVPELITVLIETGIMQSDADGRREDNLGRLYYSFDNFDAIASEV